MEDHRFATSAKIGATGPSSPVDSVRIALEGAERLAARIEDLSRRLVGSVPESNSAATQPSADGLFYQMALHADRVSAMIGDAESAILRIERAMP